MSAPRATALLEASCSLTNRIDRLNRPNVSADDVRADMYDLASELRRRAAQADPATVVRHDAEEDPQP